MEPTTSGIKKQICKEFGLSNNRMEREINFFNDKIKIMQDFGGELGATVWDASIVLTKYFENTSEFPPNFFKGKKVLELGCGCGLPGIAVSILGANVILTDRKEIISLIHENITLNKTEKRANAMALDWGLDRKEDFPKEIQNFIPFDIILMSDLIAHCYSEDYKKLIKTLINTSSKETLIIMSYEKRDKNDLEFFKLLKESFSYVKVPSEKLDPLWQSEEDIGIFTIKKFEE